MNKDNNFFFAKRIKTTIADPREKKLYSLIGFSAKAHQTNHVMLLLEDVGPAQLVPILVGFIYLNCHNSPHSMSLC